MDPQSDIGVRKDMADAQLRIQVTRRDRQPQRQIRFQELRKIQVIKGVSRQRASAFHWLVVSKLEQLPFYRINLCLGSPCPCDSEGESRNPRHDLQHAGIYLEQMAFSAQ